MAEVEILVRYSRSRLGDDVVNDLTAAGMHVHRVLRRVRVVSGSAPGERLGALQAVEGVRAVERDCEVRPA